MIGMIRSSIIPFGMSRELALQRILRLVEAGRYGREPRFADEMVLRGVMMRDVLSVIESGDLRKDTEYEECGDWRCVLTKRVGGERIRVAVTLTGDSFITLFSTY